MKLKEIYPEPNMLIYASDYIIVTISDYNNDLVAIIIGNSKKTAGIVNKHLWRRDANLKTLINETFEFSGANVSVTAVVTYNHKKEYLLYMYKSDPHMVSKQSIADKLGIDVRDLIIY